MLHDRHILQDRISRDNAAGTYKIHALPVNLQGGSQKVAHTSTQHTFGVVQDKHTHTHTHAHLMALLSWTTRVRWYQKGKTNLDFTEARDSEWQRHQLGHMQVCTSLQVDNHASISTLSFFTGRMPFLPPNQQCQSTVQDKMKRISPELSYGF